MMESGPNERLDYHQPVITEKFAAILRHSSQKKRNSNWGEFEGKIGSGNGSECEK